MRRAVFERVIPHAWGPPAVRQGFAVALQALRNYLCENAAGTPDTKRLEDREDLTATSH